MKAWAGFLLVCCVGCGLMKPYGQQASFRKDYQYKVLTSASVGSKMFGWITRGADFNVRSEIYYAGMALSTIYLSYKEFGETDRRTVARDAFTQQLQYDIASDSLIAYKSFLLRIKSANQRSIEFLIVGQPDALLLSPGSN